MQRKIGQFEERNFFETKGPDEGSSRSSANVTKRRKWWWWWAGALSSSKRLINKTKPDEQDTETGLDRRTDRRKDKRVARAAAAPCAPLARTPTLTDKSLCKQTHNPTGTHTHTQTRTTHTHTQRQTETSSLLTQYEKCFFPSFVRDWRLKEDLEAGVLWQAA